MKTHATLTSRLIAAGCGLLAAAACGAEIHVATTGDDANDGSAAKPLRTISAAAAKAQPGDTVTVHAGSHQLGGAHRRPGRAGHRLLVQGLGHRGQRDQTPSLRSQNRPFASVLAKGAKSKFLADIFCLPTGSRWCRSRAGGWRGMRHHNKAWVARSAISGSAGFQARMPKGRCMRRTLRPATTADWKSALQEMPSREHCPRDRGLPSPPARGPAHARRPAPCNHCGLEVRAPGNALR